VVELFENLDNFKLVHEQKIEKMKMEEIEEYLEL